MVIVIKQQIMIRVTRNRIQKGLQRVGVRITEINKCVSLQALVAVRAVMKAGRFDSSGWIIISNHKYKNVHLKIKIKLIRVRDIH